MIRIRTITAIENAGILSGMKNFLFEKFKGMLSEYGLSDICGIISVIVLEESEISYISDKYLEFCEEITFDNTAWLHTVWAASDGYSEDIYIPYSDNAKSVIEGRCL